MSNQVIETEAETLEEARTQAKAKLPPGMQVLYEDVISDGSVRAVRGISDTVDKAIADARSLVPSDALPMTERHVSEPRAERIRVEAFDEQTARATATNILAKLA